MRKTSRSKPKGVLCWKKNSTGRQLARVSVVKYRETVWSELYPGSKHTIACFRPAVLASEKALELDKSQRKRTVWRMDGGSGSDEQFCWLLQRDYHVIGKGYSNSRAATLAKSVRRWDAYEDYQLAEVSPPIDFGRPVRVFVKRRWKDGQFRHSYYVSTLQFPSKKYFTDYYYQRGGAEVEQFRQDKQGLYLATRRKTAFTGQQGYILLTDLVHNLLADFRNQALLDTRFANYGLKRIVRDLLNIPGRLWFDGQELKRIELLKLNQNSRDLIICLEKYILGK